MKKKLGLSLLIVLLLVSAFSLAQASDTEMRSLTAEEEAFSVYLDISSAYKEGVRYLEELDYVWSQVNSVDSVSALDEHWFLGYLINTPQDKIYNKYFYLGNLAGQFGMDAASDLYAVFRDQMQSRSKKTDAIWVILDMLAESGYIQNAKDILASLEYAKSGIRSVMAQDKEYPFLEELKSYYKDAVILQEYIDPFNDSYINFCPKLDEFKKTKTSWEIEFEFIFDPSSDEYDYVYTVRDERDYQLALAKESAGDYRGAAEIYMGIRQHKDSDARYNICMATIETANNTQQEKENEQLYSEQLYSYTLDGVTASLYSSEAEFMASGETLPETQKVDNEYLETIYQTALDLEQNKRYAEAISQYSQIASYKDSTQRMLTCYHKVSSVEEIKYTDQDIFEGAAVYSKEQGYGTIEEVEREIRTVFAGAPTEYTQLAVIKVRYDSLPGSLFYYRYTSTYNLDGETLILPADAQISADTAIPVPAETKAPQYKTLKPGSKGQAVLDARMKLYELGYFNKKPTQTEYTNNMKDYVKKFEKDYGLKQDGILSPEDQEVLFGL